ncbi:MAG: hypothetical protein Q8L55_02560, partial [Phycisphaerales bacterium]|nr:hypothetical protein [Phycisphaerales bacterium]
QREPGATGVWVGQTANGKRQTSDAKVSPALQPFADSRFPIAPSPSKIAAMGVRIRRWVSMHGLALNVNPDLSHFDLIVPCGLAGRRVTSMAAVLGAAPEMGTVKATLVKQLAAQLDARR